MFFFGFLRVGRSGPDPRARGPEEGTSGSKNRCRCQQQSTWEADREKVSVPLADFGAIYCGSPYVVS